MLGSLLSLLLVFLQNGRDVILLFDIRLETEVSHTNFVGERPLIDELLAREVVVAVHSPQIQKIQVQVGFVFDYFLLYQRISLYAFLFVQSLDQGVARATVNTDSAFGVVLQPS